MSARLDAARMLNERQTSALRGEDGVPFNTPQPGPAPAEQRPLRIGARAGESPRERQKKANETPLPSQGFPHDFRASAR